MGTFDELYASLNPNAKKRGFEFERVCRWLLENSPTYTSRLKCVWLWKEWPGRWREDGSGIDLVAEDTEGKLWAIQAKAYGEDRPIPRRELNSFLSDSSRRQFSYRLLISTTTNGLHHNAQETVASQEKPVLIVDLHDLRASDDYLTWPVSLDDLRPSPKSVPATLLPYQEEAIAAVTAGFANHDRGQLVAPFGTGRTRTALFIKERLRAENVLVVVPSLSLLKRTMQEWVARCGRGFEALPVCSDDAVRRCDDDTVSHLGVPATTDPVEIAEFLRRSGPKVVFSTYRSSPDIAKAFVLGDVPGFDFVVADEAHCCAGVTSVFTTVLDDAEIPATRRMFMTATPRVFTAGARKIADDAGVGCVSMDDEATFGPVLFVQDGYNLGFWVLKHWSWIERSIRLPGWTWVPLAERVDAERALAS